MEISESWWPSLAFRTVEESFIDLQCQEEPLISVDLQRGTTPTASIQLICNLWDFYILLSFVKMQIQNFSEYLDHIEYIPTTTGNSAESSPNKYSI